MVGIPSPPVLLGGDWDASQDWWSTFPTNSPFWKDSSCLQEGTVGFQMLEHVFSVFPVWIRRLLLCKHRPTHTKTWPRTMASRARSCSSQGLGGFDQHHKSDHFSSPFPYARPWLSVPGCAPYVPGSQVVTIQVKSSRQYLVALVCGTEFTSAPSISSASRAEATLWASSRASS